MTDDSERGTTSRNAVAIPPGSHAIAPPERHGWQSRAWHLGVALLLPAILSVFPLRHALTNLAVAQIPQLVAASVAYLATVVLVAGSNARPLSVRSLLGTAAAAIVSFGVAFVILRSRIDVTASRTLFAIACALAAAFVTISHTKLLRAARPWLASALAFLPLVCAALLLVAQMLPRWSTAPIDPPPTRDTRRLVPTALAPVTMTFTQLTPRNMPDGGAVRRLHDGFLLVTGSGAFYRLRLTQNDSVIADSLPMPAPMDRATMLGDFRGKPTPRLRVTGVLIDTTVTPAIVYVAHQFWNHAGKCFTMRVSRGPIALPEDPTQPGATFAWEQLFESQPCVVPDTMYDEYETGGRIARDQAGNILLTLGDLGYSGAGALGVSQLPNSDYGKVFTLDEQGHKKLFTLGHRNPEGLLVDHSGRIWETEHGPQGGDELNLLVAGNNYGWPLVTYGTDYGKLTWPLANGARDHGRFTEPVHAFVPSIAISDLIELGAREFPVWQGDLLVASLNARSLYRIRLHGDRVTYVEPIPVGRRIRDLDAGSDGRIVLWTDERDVVVLSASHAMGPVTTTCMACHSTSNAFGPSTAPGLFGIVGRPVASDPGFAYSEAMRTLSGKWTAARLDSFLTSPERYAPGNHMRMPGIADSTERRAIIEGLEQLR